MPYIKVTFNSAKLCTGKHYDKYGKEKKETRDRTWSGTGIPTERTDENIVNLYQSNGSPIILEPVSNMLHVLMGYRPVSTFRPSMSGVGRIEHIDDIVSTGLYRIDNAIYFTKKDDPRQYFIGELTQGKKNQCDTHRNDILTHDIDGNPVAGYCTWMNLRKKFCFANSKRKNFSTTKLEVYNNLIELLTKEYGSPIFDEKGKPMATIAEVMGSIQKGSEESRDRVKTFLKSNNLVPLMAFMGEKSDLSSFMREDGGNLAGLLNNIGMVTKVSLTGSFIFEVSEEDYQRFKEGPQYATYLDGGVAHIEYLGYDAEEWEYDENYSKLAVAE